MKALDSPGNRIKVCRSPLTFRRNRTRHARVFSSLRKSLEANRPCRVSSKKHLAYARAIVRAKGGYRVRFRSTPRGRCRIRAAPKIRVIHDSLHREKRLRTVLEFKGNRSRTPARVVHQCSRSRSRLTRNCVHYRRIRFGGPFGPGPVPTKAYLSRDITKLTLINKPPPSLPPTPRRLYFSLSESPYLASPYREQSCLFLRLSFARADFFQNKFQLSANTDSRERH